MFEIAGSSRQADKSLEHAPDGFRQALVEDYGASVPAGGRSYLSRIQAAAKRMGQLIDDLLTFSRLSRQEIRKWSVDMEKLARTLVDEAKQAEPGRTIEVTMHSLASINCDGSMMRQVWLNLISNAFKFTRRQSKPRVEISAQIC